MNPKKLLPTSLFQSFSNLSRYSLQNRPGIFGSVRRYSTGSAMESEEDKVMREFFEQLKKEQNDGGDSNSSSSSVDYISTLVKKDAAFSILLDYVNSIEGNKRKNHNADIALSVDIADLKTPISSIAYRISNQIADAKTNSDLKFAISEFTSTFLSNGGSKQPFDSAAYPKLLAACFAKCRLFRDSYSAYSLLDNLKSRGNIAFVSWMSVHAFNELLFMDWELHRDINRISLLLNEIYNGAVFPNIYTLILLERVKHDIQDGLFTRQEVLKWNEIINHLAGLSYCPAEEFKALALEPEHNIDL